MLYAVMLALLAVASVHGQVARIAVANQEPQDSLTIPASSDESISLNCSVTTGGDAGGQWNPSGSDKVVLQKRQGSTGPFRDVMAQANSKFEEPFESSGRFSFSGSKTPAGQDLAGVFTVAFTTTIVGLQLADSGTYRCVYVQPNEQNIPTQVAVSSTMELYISSPATSVSLSSTLVNDVDSNVTVTEDVSGNNEFQKRFNWEVALQVQIQCQVNGGYPAPTVDITRNGMETLNPVVTPEANWVGDDVGLQTPVTSASAVVSSYNPVSGDRKVTCSAKVGDIIRDQVAKVSFGAQLDVSCPASKKAKLDAKDVKIECTVVSSHALTTAAVSFTGFDNVPCSEADENGYTSVGKGVYCRYEKVGMDQYKFIVKISNADTADFQRYTMSFANDGSLTTSTSTELQQDKTGETSHAGRLVMPSIALLLMSFFLAL